MFIKTITYKDFNGNEQTKLFHFHMRDADRAEFMLGKSSNFPAFMRQVIAENNTSELIKTFREMIAFSVGRLSEDGSEFERDEKFTKAFMNTEAYSVLFMEMVTDTAKAIEFFKGVFPPDVADEVERELTAPEKSFEELLAMSDEEFATYAGGDQSKWGVEVLRAAYARKTKSAA